MPDREYTRLKKSIEQAGRNRVPILISRDGRVLDGRHRLTACIELGIEPHTQAWDGAGSEIDLILDLNDRRRQLSGSQRVLIAAKLAHLGRGRPQENARIGAITQEEAAEKLGVSRTQVQAARTLLASGIPALIGLVERGDLVVSAARQIAALRRDEQTRLVREGPKALRARAAAIRSDAGSQRSRSKRPPDRTLAEECGLTIDVDLQPSLQSRPGRPAEDDGGSNNGSAGATAQVERADEPIESADGEPAVLTADPVAEVSSSSTSPAGTPEPETADRCGGEVAGCDEPIEAPGDDLATEAESPFERQGPCCDADAEPIVDAVEKSVPGPVGTLDVMDRRDGGSDPGPDHAGSDRMALQPGPRDQDDCGVEGERHPAMAPRTRKSGPQHLRRRPANRRSRTSRSVPGSPIPRCSTPMRGFTAMSERMSRPFRGDWSRIRRSRGTSVRYPGLPSRTPAGSNSWSGFPLPASGSSAGNAGARARRTPHAICGTCGGACYQCE